MQKQLLAILVVATAISTGYAFAEEVQFPTLTTDGLTDMDVKTFYPNNSTYIIQISLQYTVENPLDIPEVITLFNLDGTTYEVNLYEEMIIAHFPQEEQTVVPESGNNLTDEELTRIIEEKKSETAINADNGFSKLRLCLEEFEEQQPTRFQAWIRTADLSEFAIPDEWISSDTYDRAELEAQKKWTICEALKKYQWIGAYEANKVVDTLESQSLIETNDPETSEVTQEDLDYETQRAEEYSCTNIGHQRGLCDKEFTGINRGDPDGYSIPSWYGTWQDENNSTPDTETAIERAMRTLCDSYYPLYEYRATSNFFPEWLSHCIPEETND